MVETSTPILEEDMVETSTDDVEITEEEIN